MKLRVTHRSSFAYSEPALLCHSITHLQPRSSPHQRLISSRVVISPEPDSSTERIDFFGNHAVHFDVASPHRKLTVTSMATLDVMPRAEPAALFHQSWEQVRDAVAHGAGEFLEPLQYTLESPMVAITPELREYAAPSFPPGRSIVEAGRDLTRRIHADFAYDGNATTTATPLADVMRIRRGVCQDFAHVQIGCFRAVGLPARYVSGYLLTTPPPGQRRLVGADASHAWVALYCGEAGWVDVDPTNNLLVSDEHVTIGWARDYGDISPVQGVVLGGGQHTVTVAVDVVPET